MADEDRWRRIYRNETDLYEFLIGHEDYTGNLLPAIDTICPLVDRRVVEFGAGTGRVTALLQPHVRQIFAFDLTPQMVQAAQQKRLQTGTTGWHLGVSDSRAIPLPAACADVAIEGWSFLGIAIEAGARWQAELGRALSEMERVVRPGGMMVLIETQGTGATKPEVPPAFREVYDYLEQDWGFAATWVRTDYRFASPADARAGMVPFFGEAVMDTAVATAAGIVIPECTGIWWRTAWKP